MGMLMSFMGKGLPSSQMFNMLMSTLYKQFAEKEIKNFEDFHQAFLDIFNTVNSALPGKHYDVPSRKDVEECYNKWERYTEAERKIKFVEFMKKTMKLSSLDDVTIKTGIITPPAAMAIKKAGQNVPQMKMIKAIPDVIFVPSITLIALISAKLSRKIIQRKSSPRSSLPPPPQPEAVMAKEEAAMAKEEAPTAMKEPWVGKEAPTAMKEPWVRKEAPTAMKEPWVRKEAPTAMKEPWVGKEAPTAMEEEPWALLPPSPPYKRSVPKEASRTRYYSPSIPQDFHSSHPAAS